jgi:hypothetical protein
MTTAGAPADAVRGPERLLPLACVVAAAVLGASELMHTFQISATGNVPLCNLGGGDRHHFAQLLLAGFGGICAITAAIAGSRPAARATGVAGLIALLLFLVIDLPHANNVGSVSASCDLAAQTADAKAIPQSGFWLELVGALGLAVSGIALATLTDEQLRGIRPRWLGPERPAAEHAPDARKRRFLRSDRRRRAAEAAHERLPED